MNVSTQHIAASCALCTLLLPAVCAAQDTMSLQGSVDAPLVEAEGQFTYTLELSATGRQQLEITKEPAFEPFRVLRRSRSNQTQIGPQGMSVTYTFTYHLIAPKKEGKYTIKGAQARSSSKSTRVNPVVVKVVPKGKGPPAPKGAKGTDQALLQTTVQPSNPYVGQQVIVQYKLFLDRRQLGMFGADLRGVKDPSFDGFWIEDLTKHIRTRPANVSLGGRQFSTQPIKTMAVFPLNEGEIEIGSAEAQLLVSSRRSFGRREVKVATDPVKLKALPLPPGAPPGFSKGNVGVYEFRVTTDKRGAAVGEPISLTMEVSGQGMLRRVQFPKLPELDGFRALDPVYTQETRATSAGVYGRRQAEIVLTPEREGQLFIPALTFVTFDPTKGEYQTQRSPALTLEVKGRSKLQETQEELIERERNDEPEAVKIARLPLEPLQPLEHTDAPPPAALQAAATHPLFFVGVSFPFLLGLAFSALSVARRRREGAQPEQAQQAAFETAHEALQEARKAFEQGDASGGYSALSKAVTRSLNARYGIAPGAASDPRRVHALLVEQGHEKRASQVRDLLEACSAQRFSPEYEESAAKALLEDTQGILRTLESEGSP